MVKLTWDTCGNHLSTTKKKYIKDRDISIYEFCKYMVTLDYSISEFKQKTSLKNLKITINELRKKKNLPPFLKKQLKKDN